MAENIPFLNMMARRVVETVVSRGGTAETAMPSVMVAYSLSTIMTGAIFYLTGWFRLGQVSISVDRTPVEVLLAQTHEEGFLVAIVICRTHRSAGAMGYFSIGVFLSCAPLCKR